jgi:hypothetical protein
MNVNLDLPLNLVLQIRRLIFLFIVGLVLSGITAFPLGWEIGVIHELLAAWEWNNSLSQWITFIHEGLQKTDREYPFFGYGTDWLGFAHLIIAIVFIGPLKDPIKNKWVVEFGLIACGTIIPFAFIAGEARGIPVYWRIIDCMFGVAGGLILTRCYQKIRKLELLIES